MFRKNPEEGGALIHEKRGPRRTAIGRQHFPLAEASYPQTSSLYHPFPQRVFLLLNSRAFPRLPGWKQGLLRTLRFGSVMRWLLLSLGPSYSYITSSFSTSSSHIASSFSLASLLRHPTKHTSARRVVGASLGMWKRCARSSAEFYFHSFFTHSSSHH